MYTYVHVYISEKKHCMLDHHIITLTYLLFCSCGTAAAVHVLHGILNTAATLLAPEVLHVEELLLRWLLPATHRRRVHLDNCSELFTLLTLSVGHK